MKKWLKVYIAVLFWLVAAVFLIVLCTQDTITNAFVKEFPDNFPELPESLEEWIDSVRGICVLGLMILFQWWLLGCRWLLVRYLPVEIYTAIWLFGEYVYWTDGGWGGLIVGYMMGGVGIYGVLINGTVCLVWHIRKLFRKTA